GVALYLVLPGLIAMFGSLPQLEAVFPAWFVPIFVLEAAAFVCIWTLMRIALHTDNWFDIACSQLTGNALSRALPGGAATGGATMYQMLTRSGFDGATTSTALTAVGLLSTATLFVRAVLAALGNQLFDFLALYVSLLAVGSRVDPVLVLLAYVAGSALAMIPITPGGLGFVEAGLTGVLTLAGVTPEHAVLATLLYRLFSYWLPLPSGLVAAILFRR